MNFNTLVSLIFLVLVGCTEESGRKILTCEYSQGGSDWLKKVFVFDSDDFDQDNKVAEFFVVEEKYSEERGRAHELLLENCISKTFQMLQLNSCTIP